MKLSDKELDLIIQQDLTKLSATEILKKTEYVKKLQADAQNCVKLFYTLEICVSCGYNYQSDTDYFRYIQERDNCENEIAKYGVSSKEEVLNIMYKCNLVLTKLKEVLKQKESSCQFEK